MSLTWLELKTEIELEYDLAEETFVTADELVHFVNEAIDDAEAEIHNINEKYFETETELNIFAGQAEYDFPADIYAFKITSIFFIGNMKYEVLPLQDKRKILQVQPTDDFRYRIVNSAASGKKIRLYPTPAEDVVLGLQVHYLRQANRVADDTSVIDIPEAKSFLKQYVIDKAANKERMTPDAPESPALMRKRKQLLETLSTMVPDENDELEANTEYYEEHV